MTDTTAQLLAALDTREADCTQLDEIIDRQTELIAAGRTEELLALLARKQRVTNRLLTGAREILAMHAVWEQSRLGEDERQRVRQRKQDHDARFAKLMQRDQAGITALQASVETTRAELEQLHAAEQATRAYAGGTVGQLTPPPKSLDLNG